MSGVSLTLGGKKRPAPAAFGEDDVEKKKQGEGVEVRDLDEGRDKKPKVIEMKSAGGWHKGRLSKDSNVEKIMEQVKKGGAVLADEEAPPKDVEREIPVMSGGSVQDEARMALVSDANADRDRIPGEEKTLGLTIETGKSSKRNLEDKIQLDACGEETKLQDYDSMPIGEFGMALMRGMGWKDGEALGGSRKGIIEPVEVRAQPEGLGLGAVPKEKSPPGDKNRSGRRNIRKPGEEKDHREEAKERIRKEAAARLGTFQVGMEVGIVSGRHRGLTGKISYSYAHEIMVTLSASGEEVTVDKKDLDQDVSKAKEVKTREQENMEREREEAEEREREDLRLRRQKEKQKQRDSDGHRNRDRDRDRDRDRESDRGRDRSERERESSGGSQGSWLRPHIRVRIVDKDFKGGKFYLKKARVLDVTGRGVCVVQLEDDRRLVDDVTYKMLETVLPKTGGRVMIVGGKSELRGLRGVLMLKNKDTAQASVQLTGEDMRMETVSMDDIAEFVGRDDDMLD